MLLDGYRPTKTRIASGPSPDAAPKFSQCSPFSVPTARSCERRRWEASHVSTTIQGKHAAILTLDMRLGYHNMLHHKKSWSKYMWFCSWFQINHTWFHEKTKIPPPGIFNPAGLINMPRAGCFVLEVLGMNRKNAMIKRANSETCPIRFIIRSQIVYYMCIYIYITILWNIQLCHYLHYPSMMLTIKIPSIHAPTLKETRKESWSNHAND